MDKCPIDTGKLLLVHIGDFINRIVLGKAWPEDDPNWIYLRNLAEDGSKKFSVATPLSVLPILKLGITVHILELFLLTRYSILTFVFQDNTEIQENRFGSHRGRYKNAFNLQNSDEKPRRRSGPV